MTGPGGIRLGMKVTFIPSAFKAEVRSEGDGGKRTGGSRAVTGRVTAIHWKHRWYQVTYQAGKFGEAQLREGFKF